MANVAIQVGIAVVLSYVSAKLLEDANDELAQNFKDTPTAVRGSAIPLLIGRDSIAPTVLWAGKRTSMKEDIESGKGFGGGLIGQTVWTEEGWHSLCIGPGRRLHTIRQNGKIIFQGPIDSASHPSGTTIDLGKEGQFEIYWGEQDQPVNTALGDSERVGITSSWPFICYIYWTSKRLGASPLWPRITYDFEVWPYSSKLCATPAWFVASKALVGSAEDIVLVVDGPTDTNNLIIDTGSSLYKSGGWCKMTGQGALDGDYQIDHVVKGFTASDKHRQIFLVGTITGLTAGIGKLQPYADDPDDGVNAAHIIYQILFSGFPHGQGIDPDLFDMASLENLGVLVQSENLRSTLFANRFKTVQSALADLMLDIGFMTPLDTSTGKYTFRPIRVNTDIAVLTADVIVGKPEEIETIHIDLDPANRKLFEYRDRARDYSPMPITIDDDGLATIDTMFGQKKIQMPTVRDFVTATKVAQRRDQETYSNEQRIKLTANREARKLQPGQLFSIPSMTTALLLMEVLRKDSLSGIVELIAVPDYYGILASQAAVFNGGGIITVAPSDLDEAVIPFEVPAVLNNTGKQYIGMGRIRVSPATLSSQLHLSSDDVTYFVLGIETGLHTGGTLDDAMGADGPSILDTDGPVITALGPDILKALDLSASGDKTSWERGKQIALVGSGTSLEIWFVRWLQSLGGGQYRLRDVIRHRLGTSKIAHAADTSVILLGKDNVKVFKDLLLAPSNTVFVKSQPVGTEDIPLASIPSEQLDLYGRGVRPEPVRWLAGGDTDGRYSNSYFLGNDVVVGWGYQAAPGGSSSGAGAFPAGDPVLDRAPSDGTVRVRVLDGATKKRVVNLSLDKLATYTYTWADIASDFGVAPASSSPVNFTIELSVLQGSLQSSLTTILVNSRGGTAP